MPNLIRYITQDDPENNVNETAQLTQPLQRETARNESAQTMVFAAIPEPDIKERMYPIIKEHENKKNYPYKDSQGKITVGIGENIHDLSKFGSIDWTDERGQKIRPSQALRHRQDLLNIEGNNYKADYYKDKTPLRISDKDIRQLYDLHVNDDLKTLRRTFADYDKFPQQLQNVLLDIKYNTGNVSREEWPNLHKAISERNLEEIINNVNRKQVDEKRNRWAKDEIRKIKSLDY